MAVIWGLDLHDIQWYKFKSSYMFGNTDYHLRRTKFVIYQCAMILLVVSESLGTAVLSDYLDQQNALQKQFPGIEVYNNDYIGIASYNIFVGVASAFVMGGAFFFDLFFPDRYEPRWVQNLWIGAAMFTCVAGLGDALAYTIILCLHGVRISDHNTEDPALIEQLSTDHDKTPILYRDSGRAIASVVLLWLGWCCAVASTVVMMYFYRYYRRHGTAKSTHARNIDTKPNNSDGFNSTEKQSEGSQPEAPELEGDGSNQYTISNHAPQR